MVEGAHGAGETGGSRFLLRRDGEECMSCLLHPLVCMFLKLFQNTVQCNNIVRDAERSLIVKRGKTFLLGLSDVYLIPCLSTNIVLEIPFPWVVAVHM